MNRTMLCLCCVVLLPLAARAGDIGFIEQFSLADDRTEPLKQLIPGTEDYYYFNCLHDQNTDQLDKVPALLDQWVKRYQYTSRVEEIRNRQALLEYPKAPAKSLDLIKQRLGLRFDHQKQLLNPTTDFPRALNQELISRATLQAQALGRYGNTLQGFEDSALDFLAKADLNPDRRRDWLRRLQQPDYPGLAAMVVDDLKYQNSGGFGSHRVHALLLLNQLEECLTLMPELIQNTPFVDTYLSKLRPGADGDWQHDPAEKVAYLDRLMAFARRLPPVQNSLKAHILYQRLVYDVSQNVYDKDRFMEYLKLPRPAFYVNPEYLKRVEYRDCQANLNADFRAFTALPPVGQDETLIRRMLAHFLIDAKDYAEYAEYVEQNYLKELFAETKILGGAGDMEQWYSLLPPARYLALKERVELELLPVNHEIFSAKEPVKLSLALKNTPTLIIKTYVINTLNYYRQNDAEITTAVDLDGLVANDEQVVSYKEVPLRRHIQSFEFPKIDKSGVYVIEFIANGQSSRALIRKGRLAFTERPGAAGHVFTVYDEENARLPKASLWLGGKEYPSDESGEICVPFSNQPGEQKVILFSGGFASLNRFGHEAENYALHAGIYADRESLIEGNTCKVLVRPQLSLNGEPVALSLLEEAALTILSVDQEGVQTTKVVDNFTLQADGESVYESANPASAAIRAEVKARVTATDATDDQIVAYIVQQFNAKTQLLPSASGFESLVWVLPAVAFVCAAVGLFFAFRRWRTNVDTVPDDDDRALVAAALAAEDVATVEPVGDELPPAEPGEP